jgi:hypothetical protein
MYYRRYWFEFELARTTTLPVRLRHGCGVTAEDFDGGRADARMRSRAAAAADPKSIEDVDIASLDGNTCCEHRPAAIRASGFRWGTTEA